MTFLILNRQTIVSKNEKKEKALGQGENVGQHVKTPTPPPPPPPTPQQQQFECKSWCRPLKVGGQVVVSSTTATQDVRATDDLAHSFSLSFSFHAIYNQIFFQEEEEEENFSLRTLLISHRIKQNTCPNK